MSPLRSVEGGAHDQQLPFVCPWCGDRFALRWSNVVSDETSLEAHWRENAACSNNRNVSSQRNDKDFPLGMRPVQPGEGTLRRIRDKEDQ